VSGPPPPLFLEVLIAKDLQNNVSEVL